MKLLNFCYLLYLTFIYLTFVTLFTNTLLTFLFVLVLPFHMQLFLLSHALILSALAFQINADLQGCISTDAFLDIALQILFTIFHCYFFLPFVHPFYLFIYHFISLLITFPFCFSVDLHLQCAMQSTNSRKIMQKSYKKLLYSNHPLSKLFQSLQRYYIMKKTEKLFQL